MSPTRLPVRRTLVVPPRDVVGLLASLSVFDSLSATGRLVVALADTEPASLVYSTLLHLRMRDRPPEDISEPLCLHRDAGLDFHRLRDLGFHEAVLLSGRVGDATWVTAAGIAKRWGYAGGDAGTYWPPSSWLRSLLLRPAVTRPRKESRWVGGDGEFLLSAMDVPWRQRWALHATESWSRVGKERLERAKIGGKAPVLGIYVGKGDADWGHSRGRGRTWPDTKWLELLQQLRKRRPKWRLVLISGAKELWRCVKLHEKTARLHPVIGPDLDLLGIAAVMSHFDLMIGRGDTWPVQLAGAVGTRLCAPFDGDAARRVPPPLEDGTEHLVSTQSLAKLSVKEVLDLVCEG